MVFVAGPHGRFHASHAKRSAGIHLAEHRYSHVVRASQSRDFFYLHDARDAGLVPVAGPLPAQIVSFFSCSTDGFFMELFMVR